METQDYSSYRGQSEHQKQGKSLHFTRKCLIPLEPTANSVVVPRDERREEKRTQAADGKSITYTQLGRYYHGDRGSGASKASRGTDSFSRSSTKSGIYGRAQKHCFAPPAVFLSSRPCIRQDVDGHRSTESRGQRANDSGELVIPIKRYRPEAGSVQRPGDR